MTPCEHHNIARAISFGDVSLKLGGGIACNITTTKRVATITLIGDYSVEITCKVPTANVETAFNLLVPAIVRINAVI
jgi:hypothetical protein